MKIFYVIIHELAPFMIMKNNVNLPIKLLYYFTIFFNKYEIGYNSYKILL